MLTKKDLDNIHSRNIDIQQVEKQIENFAKGFPFANITAPATCDNGILKISKNDKKELIDISETFSKENKITKFVPASGAASRMFKELFSFLDSNSKLNENEFVLNFYKNINNFAFYEHLSKALKKGKYNLSKDNIKIIVEYLLTEKGLNYGNLPKGLILFHKYDKTIKTAFEEHLVEGAEYSKGKNNNVDIVFTVSKEHKLFFKHLFKELKTKYEQKYNIKYNIIFTEQSPSTDTIAVNLDNSPYRDENNNLLFRPGGHGALINNLNDIKSDIIFIKNIDNVIHENYISDTIEYKKLIAGLLVRKREQIFKYINLLNDNKLEIIKDVEQFIENELFVIIPEKLIFNVPLDKKIEVLKNILNRPIRVCGMVKNEGEPGGGPFWVKNQDGITQLQIVESSEIDLSTKSNKEIINKATHFNPVDIVCSTINYKGEKFNLNNYVNHDAGFISIKSVNGNEIKVQELPGLWNGAMANWNTIFVEVPISTFNPVKTVNDLLRKNHQNYNSL